MLVLQEVDKKGQGIPKLCDGGNGKKITSAIGIGHFAFTGRPTTGGGMALPLFCKIISFKGSSSSIAVAIFWHQRLAPHFFGPVGGPALCSAN